MWVWIVGPIVAYLSVAFVVFKFKYANERADTFAKLEAAKREHAERLAAARAERLKSDPTAKDYEIDHIWVNDSELKKHQRWVDERVDLPYSIFMAMFWFVLIFKLLGKGVYWIFFQGDIDKAAKKKAQVLIAQQAAAIEAEKEKARLLELAKAEGLLTNDQS